MPRRSLPPSPFGFPERISFRLRWLGFATLLVIVFGVAALQVHRGAPTWVFFGLQTAALVGVAAIGVPLLMDAVARIRSDRPAGTGRAEDTPTAGPAGPGSDSHPAGPGSDSHPDASRGRDRTDRIEGDQRGRQ